MNPNINFILGKNKSTTTSIINTPVLNEKNTKENNEIINNENKESFKIKIFNKQSQNQKKDQNKKDDISKKLNNTEINKIQIQKIEDKITSHIRYIYITYNYIVVPCDKNHNLLNINPSDLYKKILEKTKDPKIDALNISTCSQPLEIILSNIKQWNKQIINIMILFNKHQNVSNLDKDNNISELIYKSKKLDNQSNNIGVINDNKDDDNNNDSEYIIIKNEELIQIKEYLDENNFLVVPINIKFDSYEENIDLHNRMFIYLHKLLCNDMLKFKLQLSQDLYIRMYPYFKYE